MIVWGGFNGFNLLNNGGAYNAGQIPGGLLALVMSRPKETGKCHLDWKRDDCLGRRR